MFTPAISLIDESEPQPLLRLPDDPQMHPQSELQQQLQVNLQNEITSLTSQFEQPDLRESAKDILRELVRFFDWLARIENNLSNLDTLPECISLLEILQFEAHSLTDYIEIKAMKAAAVNEKLREVLDGINYGINHDLRRVFEGELLRITEQSTPMVYGKVLHAHGLLTNCFQQSTITLLQVFEPKLDGATLFNDSELRLEQSLVLCKELSSLMRLVRSAEAHIEPDILSTIVQQILEFRDGTMQYLMYRDWRCYENLVLQLNSASEDKHDPTDMRH